MKNLGALFLVAGTLVLNRPPEKKRLSSVGCIFGVMKEAVDDRESICGGEAFSRAGELGANFEVGFGPRDFDELLGENRGDLAIIAQQTDGPGPNQRVAERKQTGRQRVSEFAELVQSPECFQRDIVGSAARKFNGRRHLLKLGGRADVAAVCDEPERGVAKGAIGVAEQLDEAFGGSCGWLNA